MLNELRRLFLEALRFDGDDAMPLVEKWNFAVKRVQGIFDGMTDKSSVQYIADKLAAYEDAEEQGLLVRLPCKVGDTLYAPTRNIISEFRVEMFEYGGYNERFLRIGWHLVKGITGNFRLDGIRASEIGKTVFLSREEAEAALKGEREDV